MEFIQLVMTVCLVAAPAECEEQRTQFTSQSSVYQCMFEAPLFIAQWTGEHPRWTVIKWRCAPPGSDEQKI